MYNFKENLLEELMRFLNQLHMGLEDIEWVGTHEYFIPSELITTALNIEYEVSSDRPSVDTELKIVLNDGYIIIRDYDCYGNDEWRLIDNKLLSFKPMKAKTSNWNLLY